MDVLISWLAIVVSDAIAMSPSYCDNRWRAMPLDADREFLRADKSYLRQSLYMLVLMPALPRAREARCRHTAPLVRYFCARDEFSLPIYDRFVAFFGGIAQPVMAIAARQARLSTATTP